MSILAVRHAVCEYFGGAYDESARAYLTSPVPGLGAVRRARAKVPNRREQHLDDGMGFNADGNGTAVHGTAMLVHIQGGKERRVAFAGASGGWKQVHLELVLHVFLHSSAEWAEDAQDAWTALHDALLDHIRADRTLGTGGFEAVLAGVPDPAGVQVGEGPNEIEWEADPVETRGRITRGYAIFALSATQMIQA